MKELSLDIIGKWLDELDIVPNVDKTNNTIIASLGANADFNHEIIICISLQDGLPEIVGYSTDYRVRADTEERVMHALNKYNDTHITPTGFIQDDLIKFRYSLFFSNELSKFYVNNVGIKNGLLAIKNAFVDFEKQLFRESLPPWFYVI
jgi:hypothetical protein